MDANSLPAVRAALLSMHTPTDHGIVNMLEKYLLSTAHNTMIINVSKPQLDKSCIKILYVDVECLSWSELNNILDNFPLLQCLIVRVNTIIGGTSRLLNLIDNSSENLKLFVVLVNGAHCSKIVNSSIFLSDWSGHIPNKTLHVYYQRDPYNQAVYELLDKTQLDNLLVLNCHRPMEPIESMVYEVLDAAQVWANTKY